MCLCWIHRANLGITLKNSTMFTARRHAKLVQTTSQLMLGALLLKAWANVRYFRPRSVNCLLNSSRTTRKMWLATKKQKGNNYDRYYSSRIPQRNGHGCWCAGIYIIDATDSISQNKRGKGVLTAVGGNRRLWKLKMASWFQRLMLWHKQCQTAVNDRP